MVDQIIEILCEEANLYDIRLVDEDRKGAIYLRQHRLHINPRFLDERAETFTHEMLHHYYDQISVIRLGSNEESVIEMEMQTLMKSRTNKNYILDYLKRRGIDG